MKDKAFITALVRGIAFALITLLYTVIPVLQGFLWCIYIGFFLTMAFGAKKKELPNYICSLLAGYIWSFGYVYGHVALESMFGMPTVASLPISELILTFLLIFVHLKFLGKTWLNKVPAVFAAVATVFAAGGIDNIVLCAVSAIAGIAMAIITEVIIVGILKKGNNK